MPTYEYQCTAGHTFEAFQKISERPKSKCPICGKSAKRKITGGAGLVFKGSGFYITDYGKDGKGPRKEKNESSAGSETKGESAASGKAESKPAESSSKSATNKAEGKPSKPKANS